MNYCFLRIPRTASTSICKALNNYPDHKTAIEWRERYPDWNNRFKFTIVRNPYDRFISMYSYFSEVPFDEFMSKRLYESDLRFRPQVDYLYEKNNLLVDYVGRFEDLENSWKIISDKLKLSNKLEHLKESKRTIILSENQMQQIYSYYQKDFLLLGYNNEL